MSEAVFTFRGHPGRRNPCDELGSEFPNADLCLFVDDRTIQVIGMAGTVAETMQAAVSSCISKLETELQLTVSRSKRWQLDAKGKTILVVLSTVLAMLLEPKMRAMGLATRQHAKLQGIDFAGGKRVVRLVHKSKLKAVVGRRHR